MKTLIVYYSFTQNNEKLVGQLKEQLQCDVVRLETVKKHGGMSILFDLMFKRLPALKPVPYYLKDYDHVIFVAPVWSGRIATPLKSFLKSQVAYIRSYSFITICGGGDANQGGHLHHELSEVLKKEPVSVMQLWLKDLPLAERNDGVQNVTRVHVDQHNLEQFKPQILEFLNEISLVEVR